MNWIDVIFLAVAGITLLGGFIAVWPKNVFYNALGFILSMMGIAALFIFLNSEFLAVVEVVIYIGAISIAIIFAIMLSRPWANQHIPRSPMKMIRSLLTGGLLFAGLFQILKTTAWPAASVEGDYSMKAIGTNLLTVYSLPFEVVSVVLLVAIIGALVVSGTQETGS